MKTSELIKLATEAIELNGDQDVVILTDTPTGEFAIVHDVTADSIEYPTDPYEETFTPVFAVGWSDCLCENEPPVFKPHLKLVVGGR